MLSKKLKVYLYSGFALTAVAVIMLSLTMFMSFNESNTYFDPSIFGSIFKGVVVVAITWFLSVLILVPKGRIDGGTPLTLPVAFPSGLMALVCAGIGVITLLQGFGVSLFKGLSTVYNVVLIGTAIFMFVAAVYFVMNVVLPQTKKLDSHAMLGFSVPVASILLIADCYFDISVSMNMPAKLFFQMTIISFMLFMLTELRAIIGKPLPRCYMSFGLITMFVSAFSSVPWLIYAARSANGSIQYYPTYYIYNIFSLGICAYVIVRLIVFVSSNSLLERLAEQTYDEPEGEE